ncbi:MAG TPA: nicotinate phosphoribosyltransferase [Myxococcales bacterium]|nr:nicotinate phosphoribosyltransferase [Myxococcales bacterium]
MKVPSELYRPSLALLTDLYQLTMAYAYWKSGVAEREAVFYLHFRENPFQGGFAVACGLGPAVDYVETLRFDDDDLAYLASLNGADGKPLFEPAFLDHLRGLRLACDLDAVPEGTVVFPQEPLVRVKGPILHCQLLETPLLTLINFQTLVATKAARVKLAAKDQPVVEFGLRRAQGIDGGLSSCRAAFVGGVDATSNLLAGRIFGIPVRGTHAHSFVLAFEHEQQAFQAYAEAMPNNCILLVDTFDSLEGTRRAAQTGRWLREHGHELLGIRLDSGDLAYLSIRARAILDEEGFPNAKIVASGDLDEQIIESLQEQGARIDLWGVGTRLATAFDQPALGGIYKLSAVREPGGRWEHRLKLSEQLTKTTTPGILQTRRFTANGLFAGDMIWDELLGPGASPPTIVDPSDATRRQRFSEDSPGEDLLVPVFRGGQKVYEPPPLDQARERTRSQLSMLHPSIKRFLNPHSYPAGLEETLHLVKTRLILKARQLQQ